MATKRDRYRTKVNKNSKFNKIYKNAEHRDMECNRIVVSAELYDRKQAFNKIKSY